MFNSYWPVYKNLEDEILEVAKYIQFDDDQLDVYSIKIADLLVRCVIEIESLSKELYWGNGGQKQYDLNGNERRLYFDTDCIKFLDDLWGLCEKQIFVTSAVFYFCKEENRVLNPLKKANKRGGAKWNKAYQSVKHDRKNNLKQGNIKNLLNALGALYILNLYYNSEVYKLGHTSTPKQDFNSRLGSSIFSVYFLDVTVNVQMGGVETDDAIEKNVMDALQQAVYVLKYTADTWKSINNSVKDDNNRLIEQLKNSKELHQYFSDNPSRLEEEQHLISLVVKCFGKDYFANNNSFMNFHRALKSAQIEAVIYKKQPIYG